MSNNLKERFIYIRVDRVRFRLIYFSNFSKNVLFLLWINRYCGGEVPRYLTRLMVHCYLHILGLYFDLFLYKHKQSFFAMTVRSLFDKNISNNFYIRISVVGIT